MGVVFQFFQLLPMLTLLENILLPMDFAGRIPPGERDQRARELLAMVELEGFADLLPAELSGGQQQSAAVARSLANDPPIIMADEPTGNLDSRSAEKVFKMFEQLAAQGKTILMVTHDDALAQRARRKLVISDGELLDERITRAFTSLRHSELLRLAHTAQSFQLAPGERLSPDPGPGLYWATRGKLLLEGAPRGGKLRKPFTIPEWQPFRITGAEQESTCSISITSPWGSEGMRAGGQALTSLLKQAPVLERLLLETPDFRPQGPGQPDPLKQGGRL
jgi:putative ABC transport system ATP-binding protein